MVEEVFNPDDHMWRFVYYSNYEFTFCTINEPFHYAIVGGYGDDICRYEVTAAPMTYDEITDGGSVELVHGDWND